MSRPLFRGLSALAAAAVTVGAVVLAGGTSASAADAGPLAKVDNGNSSLSTGTNFDTVKVTAPAACDASATKHTVKIKSVVAASPGDQAEADKWAAHALLYSPSSVGMPGPITDYPSSGSWQQIADAAGIILVPGTYSFNLQCQNNLATTVYEEWSGGVVFDTKVHWTAFVGTAPAVTPTPTPTPPPTPTPAPTPTPVPTTPAPTTPVPTTPVPTPTVVTPGDTIAPVSRITRLANVTLATAAVGTWAGADAVGVASYDLRLRSAMWNKRFGSYTFPASLQKTKAVSVSLPLVAGAETCISVRARDAAGNLSAWSADRCSARPLDDRALTAKGAWTKTKGKSLYARTARTAKVKGATLTRSGSLAGRVSLSASKGKGNGKVGVYYNGKLVKTVDLSAKRSSTKNVIALPRLAKAGTISLKVLTTGKTVQVDGLLIAAL